MKRTTILALLFGALLATTATVGSAQSADPKTRLQIAERMFQDRCKKAGEFIYRTAENVEGVFLMKLRPKGMNYDDQFAMDDPYGRDSSGKAYIKIFFAGFYKTPSNPPPTWAPRLGYSYVEAVDPNNGKRYRYTGAVKEVTKTASILMGGDGKTTFKTKEFVLDRVPATGPAPRYGITYDDISTHEEREYWIAGSSLKVLDLKTNEVMAERIGYMMDRGQGNTSGGRAPWLLAADNACPPFLKDTGGHTYQTDQTQDFVVKILKPRIGG